MNEWLTTPAVRKVALRPLFWDGIGWVTFEVAEDCPPWHKKGDRVVRSTPRAEVEAWWPGLPVKPLI